MADETTTPAETEDVPTESVEVTQADETAEKVNPATPADVEEPTTDEVETPAE